MRAYSRTFLPVEVGQRSNSGGSKMADSIREKLSEGEVREGVVQVWVGGIEEWQPELARALVPMPLSSRMVCFRAKGRGKELI